MMRYFLESEGHAVMTAADGTTALKVFEQFLPEAVILDIGMPGLSGYTVAEQIRAQAHQPLKLIALSGLGQEEDKRRAVEAGFDVHFTKPVDIPTLNKLLASIAKDRSGPSGAPR